MAMLTTATNAETKALDLAFPGWREMAPYIVWLVYRLVDPEMVLWRVDFWIVKRTFRVRDLRWLIEQAVGPEPTGWPGRTA